jgi:hypothetical protein
MLDLKIPLQPKQAELYDIYENSPCTRIGAGGSRGGAKSHAARSISFVASKISAHAGNDISAQA